MFSNVYESLDKEIRVILSDVTLPTTQEVGKILEKSKSQKLSLEEIARLLQIWKQSGIEEQFDLIRNFTYSQFRKENSVLRHIAPVYLSSHCIDTCAYCNFSANRKDTQRTRLSLSQLVQELTESILPIGSRVIEFTLATDPEFTPEKLAEYISRTRELLGNEKGSGILLCSDYFSREKYELLRQAGLWGMVQWDETLNRERYRKWHGNSPRKSDFERRIDNHDRAIQAGLQVATGILFGLSDYRYDVLMQIAKARYLEQEYGIKPFVFGTPRLKPIGGVQLHPKDEVSDRQYELALMVYKIGEPSIARWLQTRETPELNFRNFVDGDICTFQCGEVKPGGYRVNKDRIVSLKGGQFAVNEMTKPEFENTLRTINFGIDYEWVR